MTLAEDVQQAVKAKRALLGYRESIKFLKAGMPGKIVVAANAPDSVKKEIEHNAKLANVGVETFSGSSKELGVLCGKPFVVTVLTIK